MFDREPRDSLCPMPRKVWTAAELDEMTPAEVDALFQASIVKDLDEVPPAFLARVRADVEAHIAATEAPQKP
ncbi:MAG: hypothetical protein R2716_14035 [Microthrixaceae bacterium]